MNVIAVNGSPRKQWNTATLLGKALEGAVSRGAETELYHLYDLDYKGCRSCFACKTIGVKSYGTCGFRDGLTPVLKKIEHADALILGSPIYLGSVTGEMSSFLERLLYPYLTYTAPIGTLFPKRINVGFIYTMNSTKEQSTERGYEYVFNNVQNYLQMILGKVESLYSFDTYQFEDYSKVLMKVYDRDKKAERHDRVFPEDCRKAYELGERLARKEAYEITDGERG